MKHTNLSEIKAKRPGTSSMASPAFPSDRTGRGTREWADRSYNICIGCEHDCLYCSAKAKAHRFKGDRLPRGGWAKQKLNPKAIRFGQEMRSDGLVMFPTTHDLTPSLLPYALLTIKNLLVHNEVLIVTKPHLSVIRTLCRELKGMKNRIYFRFTIGSLKPEVCAFWEPGAPSPQERIQALRHAHQRGFSTSVSIEPMLDSIAGTCALVDHIAPFVTDLIWVGKMRGASQQLNARVPGFIPARKLIRSRQTEREILRLSSMLMNNPKVRAKASIAAVCCKYL